MIALRVRGWEECWFDVHFWLGRGVWWGVLIGVGGSRVATRVGVSMSQRGVAPGPNRPIWGIPRPRRLRMRPRFDAPPASWVLHQEGDALMVPRGTVHCSGSIALQQSAGSNWIVVRCGW